MSNQERIEKEIEENKLILKEIEEDIEKVSNELKEEGLSEEKKKELNEKLENLEAELLDILADIAMLQELLNKHYAEEESPDGGYDGWDEVFTGGDY